VSNTTHRPQKTLLDAKGFAKALDSMAKAIAERHPGLKDVALAGIRTRGVFLAKRLQNLLEARAGHPVPLGILDITLYRDDLTVIGPKPIVRGSEISFPLDGKILVLVDDVLFTGRTVRAALTELMDFGRPKKIELAVMADRGHRELPVAADYAAVTVDTTLKQAVHVFCREKEGEDKIVLEELEKEAQT
jgi:pyrimidine operon attenuation protein/uracil phosphoribosyltransferase